jgi:hypothetical protein
MNGRRAHRGGAGLVSPLLAAIIAVFLLPAYARAETLTARDRVNQAVEAMGGADALRALRGLAISGEVRHWEPEESYSPWRTSRLH